MVAVDWGAIGGIATVVAAVFAVAGTAAASISRAIKRTVEPMIDKKLSEKVETPVAEVKLALEEHMRNEEAAQRRSAETIERTAADVRSLMTSQGRIHNKIDALDNRVRTTETAVARIEGKQSRS